MVGGVLMGVSFAVQWVFDLLNVVLHIAGRCTERRWICILINVFYVNRRMKVVRKPEKTKGEMK